MKAMLYRQYGPPDVLHLEEVEKPIPGDGEVLVKILVASVNTLDLSMRGPMLALWLLVKGVNAERWKEQEATAGERP
jgi:NADPH:quinone reductase-like Zn-dependent oxidoreductase